jgi:hypothetical protein
MTTYVVITEHPPQLCQTSNPVSQEMYRQLPERIAAMPDSGVDVKIGPLITSDHRSFWVIEAQDYERLRVFVVNSGLIQWNSVTTIPVISNDTALEEVNSLATIW